MNILANEDFQLDAITSLRLSLVMAIDANTDEKIREHLNAARVASVGLSDQTIERVKDQVRGFRDD